MNSSLKAEVQMLTTSSQELKGLNSCLRDEHTALQMAFASMEKMLRKVQVSKYISFLMPFLEFALKNYFYTVFKDENRTLVDRLMKYKSKDVEKMNDENESFLK